MKAKKKRKWVWCSQTAIDLDLHTWSHYADRPLTKRRPNTARTAKEAQTNARKNLQVPSKIKCPLCKKKFKPRVRECHDRGCWHIFVPPHKKYE